MSLTPIRRSSLICNCLPLYHKEKQLIIFAVDKTILLLDSDREQRLTGHTDTVVGLSLVDYGSPKLVSFGLDGKIIHWNLLTSDVIKKYTTGLPIYFLDGQFVGQQSKSHYSLKEYDSQFMKAVTIFESSSKLHFSSGGSKELPFIALANASELFIYWKSFKTLVSYQLPWPKEYEKTITCVATHPSEASLATGNHMGEIFIWWGLASKVLPGCHSFDQLLALDEDSDDESRNSDSFVRSRGTIVDVIKDSGVSAYPVHPSRVKCNLVHWHCCPITSICFTSSGSHLLSGGLEGVMVKWDLTSCYGGPRHRRFLPRLGAPIKALASPGGPCEDAIMVALENNTFHVLSSSLKPIFTKQGYVQMPPVWSLGVGAPSNLLILYASRGEAEKKTVVMTNAGFGALQLTDPLASKSSISKMDVTHQYAVPRPSDTRVPVAYSEVLLVAQLPGGSQASDATWLVTYERMVPSSLPCLDDQARLTWWHCASPSGDASQQPSFKPVDSISLSYLNSPATDLGFVPSKDLFLLLQDFRMLIWCANAGFDESPNSQAPWLLRSCVRLNDPMQRRRGFTRPTGSPKATVIPLVTSGGLTAKSGAGRVRNRGWTRTDFALLVADNSVLALYTLSSLLKPDAFGPITRLELSSLKDRLPSVDLDSSLMEIRSLVDRPQLVNGVSGYRAAGRRRCLALAVRGKHRNRATPESDKMSPLTTGSFGILCLMKLVPGVGRSIQLIPMLSQLGAPITCICTHNDRPLLAMALSDGNVMVSEVRANAADGSTVTTHLVQTFASLPAHPVCDRKGLHRGGRRKALPSVEGTVDGRLKQPYTTTRLCRLAFLPSEQGELVGLMDTVYGRQTGRRDLVLFGQHPRETPQHDSSNLVFGEGEPRGLLRLVEAVSPATPGAVRQGRKRTSSHLDEALREVSQYPIATAPPPEQLLRQLMKP